MEGQRGLECTKDAWREAKGKEWAGRNSKVKKKNKNNDKQDKNSPGDELD